jgi:hypothetical protein
MIPYGAPPLVLSLWSLSGATSRVNGLASGSCPVRFRRIRCSRLPRRRRTDPVQRLDAPLAPCDPREAGGVGLPGVEAGDGVDDFPVDQPAVGVVAVAADPGDPADVREAGPRGIGDPDGAADCPAVGAVQPGVVRVSRA